MVQRDDDAVLGARLRRRRLDLGLSQVELAERANVSLGTVKGLEAGTGSTVRSLGRVLRAIGEAGWVDRLVPEAATFNPLDLLEATRRPPRRRAPRRHGASRGGR